MYTNSQNTSLKIYIYFWLHYAPIQKFPVIINIISLHIEYLFIRISPQLFIFELICLFHVPYKFIINIYRSFTAILPFRPIYIYLRLPVCLSVCLFPLVWLYLFLYLNSGLGRRYLTAITCFNALGSLISKVRSNSIICLPYSILLNELFGPHTLAQKNPKRRRRRRREKTTSICQH